MDNAINYIKLFQIRGLYIDDGSQLAKKQKSYRK